MLAEAIDDLPQRIAAQAFEMDEKHANEQWDARIGMRSAWVRARPKISKIRLIYGDRVPTQCGARVAHGQLLPHLLRKEAQPTKVDLCLLELDDGRLGGLLLRDLLGKLL